MDERIGGQLAMLADFAAKRQKEKEEKQRRCDDFRDRIETACKDLEYTLYLLRGNKKTQRARIMWPSKVPFNVKHPARWSE